MSMQSCTLVSQRCTVFKLVRHSTVKLQGSGSNPQCAFFMTSELHFPFGRKKGICVAIPLQKLKKRIWTPAVRAQQDEFFFCLRNSIAWVAFKPHSGQALALMWCQCVNVMIP